VINDDDFFFLFSPKRHDRDKRFHHCHDDGQLDRRKVELLLYCADTVTHLLPAPGFHVNPTDKGTNAANCRILTWLTALHFVLLEDQDIGAGVRCDSDNVVLICGQLRWNSSKVAIYTSVWVLFLEKRSVVLDSWSWCNRVKLWYQHQHEANLCHSICCIANMRCYKAHCI
jgi:hypothetical protein